MSDQLIFEIKDLTCNAQFNFCLLFDRSEFAHSAAAKLAPGSAESCDKFQNQTFKDQCCSVLPGDKKLNLGADVKARASRRSFHCRDKIEFNLKSQKLEELSAVSGSPALLRDKHFSRSLLLVNEDFEFSSISFAACIFAFRYCSPTGWRDAEASKALFCDKRNFQKVSVL